MQKKPVLFIGSTVVDIRMVPSSFDEISKEVYSLGGCAYNAAMMCHLMKVDYLLYSPVGVNAYADFVRTASKERGLHMAGLVSEEENGRCICRIDASGERHFSCTHGAEYRYKEQWLIDLDALAFDMVYICGLEIEEDSGRYIVDYLERHPHLVIWFACGPRITSIPKERMERIFRCGAILHLNDQEALSYTGCTDIKAAAQALYAKTHAMVIITLGQEGCIYYDGMLHHIPTKPVKQLDTTGAGDAHIGTTIAMLAQGYSLQDALFFANHIAGHIVTQTASTLDLDTFKRIQNAYFRHD